jgi:hypothetical protein
MANPIQELMNRLKTGNAPALANYRYRAKRKRKIRTLKRRPWDAFDNIFNLGKIMNESDNKIFLGTSDFDDLIKSQIFNDRVSKKLKTLHRQTSVIANRSTWAEWIESEFSNAMLVQGNSSGGFIIFPETSEYISYSVNSNSTDISAYGSEEFANSVIQRVERKFTIVTSYIEWIYSSDGNSVNVPLNRDRLPVAEMYPFLKGESLESYYDRYLDSTANILLLIGPPGTGKTTFIRGLLAHRNSSAIVTYDAQILEKDGFFARFIEDDANIMVLEDSDAFLKSRSDGNTMMHRFLNVGDGLVTTRGKKMVFSTNLPSIRDVDSALVRPGRCFDVVTFDALGQSDAIKLADKLGVPITEGKDKYSIAEIFNQQSEQAKSAVNRKVGFI